MNEIGSFFKSEKFIYYYQKLSMIAFWISIPICLAIAFFTYHMAKKYDARRNEIEKEINAPGMEDVRWLLKHKLKEHGIEPNTDTPEKISLGINIERKVTDIIVKQLGVKPEQVKSNTNFVQDLAAYSLDTVVTAFEEEFGLKISEEDAKKMKNVKDVVRYLEERINKK